MQGLSAAVAVTLIAPLAESSPRDYHGPRDVDDAVIVGVDEPTQKPPPSAKPKPKRAKPKPKPKPKPKVDNDAIWKARDQQLTRGVQISAWTTAAFASGTLIAGIAGGLQRSIDVCVLCSDEQAREMERAQENKARPFFIATAVLGALTGASVAALAVFLEARGRHRAQRREKLSLGPGGLVMRF